MRTKIAPLSLFLILGITLISFQAKAAGPQPEQGDKYDLGASNLTLFKLFTVHPEKKNPNKSATKPKAPAHKIDADKKEQLVLPTPVLDRFRR